MPYFTLGGSSFLGAAVVLVAAAGAAVAGAAGAVVATVVVVVEAVVVVLAFANRQIVLSKGSDIQYFSFILALIIKVEVIAFNSRALSRYDIIVLKCILMIQ